MNGNDAPKNKTDYIPSEPPPLRPARSISRSELVEHTSEERHVPVSEVEYVDETVNQPTATLPDVEPISEPVSKELPDIVPIAGILSDVAVVSEAESKQTLDTVHRKPRRPGRRAEKGWIWGSILIVALLAGGANWYLFDLAATVFHVAEVVRSEIPETTFLVASETASEPMETEVPVLSAAPTVEPTVEPTPEAVETVYKPHYSEMLGLGEEDAVGLLGVEYTWRHLAEDQLGVVIQLEYETFQLRLRGGALRGDEVINNDWIAAQTGPVFRIVILNNESGIEQPFAVIGLNGEEAEEYILKSGNFILEDRTATQLFYRFDRYGDGSVYDSLEVKMEDGKVMQLIYSQEE